MPLRERGEGQKVINYSSNLEIILLKSKKEEIARKEWTMGWGPRD